MRENNFFKSLRTFTGKHPMAIVAVIFVLVWIAASFTYFLKYPENLLYPNFFAEDGRHFVVNVMQKGFLEGPFTLFNGYFIFGLFALTEFGFLVNLLLFGGEFFRLPEAFAITSYTFLGLCSALPILLLRKYLTMPYLLGLCLLLALLPMPVVDYVIIGTIGNLKFPFAYIAVLLMMYRFTLPRDSRLIFLVDVFILLCVYTVAGAYLVLPFLLFCDGLRPSQLLKRSNWSSTFRSNNYSLWSGLGLCFVAALQVLMILINGLPELPGYLDEPYKASNTIELFIGRPILYPFVSAIYDRLNDIIVIGLLLAAIICMWKLGRKENWKVFILGLAVIFGATAAFVIGRPGISHHYNNYVSSVFDNFFYTQNFIFIVLIMILLADTARRFVFVRKLFLPVIFVALAAVASVYITQKHAPNDFMHFQLNTIGEVARKACESGPISRYNTVHFTVFPFKNHDLSVDRDILCTPALASYVSPLQSFGLEAAPLPLNISYGNPAFYQTFTANQDGLKGLAVMFGTYDAEKINMYTLRLMDESCKQTLREVNLSLRVHNNMFRAIDFPPVQDSKGKTFCFSVQPDSEHSQPMALYLSAENVYNEGSLTILETPHSRDVVFLAIYGR